MKNNPKGAIVSLFFPHMLTDSRWDENWQFFIPADPLFDFPTSTSIEKYFERMECPSKTK